MVKLVTLFALVFLFVHPGAVAQNKPRQAALLEKEISLAKADTNKVLLCLELVELPGEDSIRNTINVINTALKLSQSLNYFKGMIRANVRGGIYFEDLKNYNAAIHYYNDAKNIAEQHHLNYDLYDIYNASLNLYYYQADYTHAMDLVQKGLALAEQMNDKEDQAHYNNQIGYIYLKQEKADDAIKYYRQCLLLAKATNNNMMIASACDGIADGYMLKAEYQTALNYLFKALAIYNKMNRSERIDKRRTVFKPDKIVYTLYKLSKVYKLQGDDKEALRYSQTLFAEIAVQKIGFNNYDLASYDINMGDIYRKLNDHNKANLFLNRGLLLAQSIFHREDMRDAYLALSQNFAAQNRYDSAYRYQLLFNGLKDSIINQKVSQQINKLEVERRDKEIALLNQQQKLKETEAARKNLTINLIIGFITFIVIISFLLFYIKSGIKHQKLIFEKQLAIQRERQRISSDMHDDIGTGLSTMLIYINMLKLKMTGSDDAANIDRIAILGTGLVDQMKEIVWALSPGNDKLDSLLLFIRQYFVLLFEPLNYTMDINYPAVIPDIELESELRRNIFLCVKEALNNIIKHAKATHAELDISIVNRKLNICIKDNGYGLPPDAEPAPGNGLKNIARRMGAINGKFDLFNGNGVTVCLQIDLSSYPNG